MNTAIQGLQICAAGTCLRLSSSGKSLNVKDSGQVGHRCCALGHGRPDLLGHMHENRIRFWMRVELAMQPSGTSIPPHHSSTI